LLKISRLCSAPCLCESLRYHNRRFPFPTRFLWRIAGVYLDACVSLRVGCTVTHVAQAFSKRVQECVPMGAPRTSFGDHKVVGRCQLPLACYCSIFAACIHSEIYAQVREYRIRVDPLMVLQRRISEGFVVKKSTACVHTVYRSPVCHATWQMLALSCWLRVYRY
jgi:hypothetical protein